MNRSFHDRLLLPWLPWSSFNSLGRSRIVRSSYLWAALVPVLAKMLSAINRDFNLPILSSNLHIILGVPFTWELLYYSAVSFALATLAYTVACPEIVKKYDKYSDFEAEGKGGDQLVAYALGITSDRTQKNGQYRLSPQQLLRFVRSYCGQSQINTENLMQLEEIRERFIDRTINIQAYSNDAFWFIRGCADHHSTWCRAVVGVLYGSGFAFFGWVMGQNFWFVFSHHVPIHG